MTCMDQIAFMGRIIYRITYWEYNSSLLQDMIQKPFAISVIVAVVVAGILTLSVLVGISSTKQAFAQATSTSLTLGAFPNKGKVGSAGTLPVSLSGKLTSEGSPVYLWLPYILPEQAKVNYLLSQLINSVAIFQVSRNSPRYT